MSALLERIEEVKRLKNGNGFQYLIEEAYKILGNPLMMFDTYYKIITCTEGVVTDDPFWNEIAKNGVFCEETQEFFKEEGFIDAVANSKTITFLFSDKLKYKRFQGKIFNRNNTHVANLVMVMCNKPYEPSDAVIFEAVCKAFSNELSGIDFYQDYERKFMEIFIKKLIDGDFINKELYAAHIAIVYDSLKTNLFVAALGFKQTSPDYEGLTYFRDLLWRLRPDFKYSIYREHIVILMSSDNASLDIKRDLNKFSRLFKNKNIYAGISGCFENIYELPKYYAEAVAALNFGRSSSEAKRIFFNDGRVENSKNLAGGV